MKAIHFTEYGSPDVLRLVEIEKPIPKESEVLVKVHAASVNPLDWHIMRAEPFIARFDSGLQRPKSPKLGADFAGVIEAIGSKVQDFKVGDEVFGEVSFVGLGSFAEYLAAPEHAVALKPKNVSFNEAAAVPVVGFTAIQGLSDTGKIQAGQEVLVNGASGGVGNFAVQYAKAMGARVIGVCSGRNAEMVLSTGADEVIDYTKQDFCKMSQKYDLVYDAVGNRSVNDLRASLKENGRAVVAGFTTLPRLFETMIWGAIVSRFGTKFVGMMGTAQANNADLLIIQDLLATGKVKPVIDRCYPLEETAEAIRYLETMRARGKVIISVG